MNYTQTSLSTSMVSSFTANVTSPYDSTVASPTSLPPFGAAFGEERTELANLTADFGNYDSCMSSSEGADSVDNDDRRTYHTLETMRNKDPFAGFEMDDVMDEANTDPLKSNVLDKMEREFS